MYGLLAWTVADGENFLNSLHSENNLVETLYDISVGNF